jgi:hypothetical protein
VLAVIFSLVALPAVGQPAGRTIQGRIISAAPDQFIVLTPDKRQLTVYVNPQTRYLMNSRAAGYSDLRVGSTVTAACDLDGRRYVANNVAITPTAPVAPAAPASPPAATAPPPAAPATPAPPADGTLIQGRVVRTVGPDQVVIQTAAGQEMVVYVSPQTVYRFNDGAGQYTDLRPGFDVGVYYDVRDRRNVARRIIGPFQRR